MPIMLAFIIIATAVTAIMYQTYVGYGQYKWYTKLAFLLFLVLSVSAPFINFWIQHGKYAVSLLYLSKFLYFLFGFVFFLFLFSLIRDIIWTIRNLICRIPLEEMKDSKPLQKANIITIIISLLFCFYGVYEAEKSARLVSYDIISPKIKQNTKLVLISDLHIDIDVSPKYVANLVNRVNALKPDIIVLNGDLVDNYPKALHTQMEELGKLKAKKDIFVVLGNHEFYYGAFFWGITFAKMGFSFLGNTGAKVADTGIYVAGMFDLNTVETNGMKVSVKNALYGVSKDDYVIMLSHSPKIAKGITKKNVDLQLSSHTHGGQIFPFHYFAKQLNEGRLAGFYDVNGVKMYITRGTRYWGPPMRILAPSEITVFNFLPEKNEK